MKRAFILLSVLLSTGLIINAQVLWKIKSAASKQVSYIFVTHKLIPIAYLDSIPGLFSAFGQCETVISEIALNRIEDIEKIKNASILPDQEVLSDLLSIEDYALAEKEIPPLLHIELSHVARMHPIVLLPVFEAAAYKKAEGFLADSESDSYFQLVAQQQGKKTVGLDKAEEQIETMRGNISPEGGAQLLSEALRDKEKLISRLKEEVRLYKQGTLEALSESRRKEAAKRFSTDETYNNYLKRKNTVWSKHLVEHIDKAPCFINVGAEYLTGRYGLFEMLRGKGYSIRPVQ